MIVSSGPIGAAPWETIGSISTPSSRTPTAPSSTISSPKNSASRRPACARSTGRPAAAASAARSRQVGAAPRRWGTVTGRRAGSRRPRRPGRPCRSARRCPLDSSTRAWNGSARRPSRSPPHTETAEPPSISRPWPITPPAPQPISAAGARTSWIASSVASGAARCAPDTNTIASSHASPFELGGRRGRRHQRRSARVEHGRQARRRCGRPWPADDTPRVTRPPRAPDVIAVFGPTGVGKTAVAIALARRLRARGEDPVAVSADALQVYAGLPILTGAPDRGRAARARAPAARLRAARPSASRPAPTPARAHHEIDALLADGPAPDRRRRHRPLPARRAGRARPAPAASTRPIRARWRAAVDSAGRRHVHAQLAARDPKRQPASTPTTASASSARTSCSTPAHAAARAATELWTTHTRHPTPARRAGHGPRGALRRASTPASTPWSRGRRTGGRKRRRGRAPPTPPARPLGFEELLDGDVEAMKTQHPPLRQAPAHVAAQAARRAPRRRHRPRRRTTSRPSCSPSSDACASRSGRRWATTTSSSRRPPFELTPERVAKLLLRPALRPRRRRRAGALRARRARLRRARCGSSTPTAREAELSGNGAREAILYLRRHGWTEHGHVLDHQTLAGEIRPDDHRPDDLHASTWAAPLPSTDFPAGRRRPGAAAAFRFQHVDDRQPAVRDPRRRPRRARPAGRRPADRARTGSSPTAPTSPSGASAPRTRSAPASSSAAWGRRSSTGTGASGAAVAHVLARRRLARDRAAGRRRAEVDVDESLHVDLTGWAVPVYRGELGDEFIEELHATR